MFKKIKIILALIALGIVVALCVILPVVLVDDKPEDEGTNNPLEFQSLKFTILDEKERTVSVAAKSREVINENFHDSILVIPSKVVLNEVTYTVTEIERAVYDYEKKEYVSGGFIYCEKLYGVEIPKTITNLGWSAFYGCSSLKTVKILSGAYKNLSSCTFQNCTSLESVELAYGVTGIDNAAFFGCSNLTTIKIPDSVTIIYATVFIGCKNLTSVILPASLTLLGENAFMGCKNLEKIYYKGSREQWDAIKKYKNPEIDNAEIIFDFNG